MATNAYIGILNPETNIIRYVYLHFDGYGALPLLNKHYNTQEKADKLISLGDISILAESCECPEGHSFTNKIPGYSVFYGRDRGETGQGPKTLPKFMFHYDFKKAYRYVFKNGEWFQTSPGDG